MKLKKTVIALNYPPKNGGKPINEVEGHNIFTDMCGCASTEDSVYMSSHSFAEIFGRPRSKCCRPLQRLAVIKIKSVKTKHVIFRKYVYNPEFSGLNDSSLALNPASIRELGENSEIVGSEVTVCPGCVFPYYWFHPFHATRISTKLGVISIAIAILSICISLLSICNCS